MPREHRLVLMPLDERSWRLCDRSVPHHDPRRVVAYVEVAQSGGYQVTWVSVGFGSARYSSLEALLHAAVKLISSRRSSGALKPQPIPHRPPAHA